MTFLLLPDMHTHVVYPPAVPMSVSYLPKLIFMSYYYTYIYNHNYVYIYNRVCMCIFGMWAWG